jgi:hypothetical protein
MARAGAVLPLPGMAAGSAASRSEAEIAQLGVCSLSVPCPWRSPRGTGGPDGGRRWGFQADSHARQLAAAEACRGVELAGKLATIAVAARGLRGDKLESRVTCSAG